MIRRGKYNTCNTHNPHLLNTHVINHIQGVILNATHTVAKDNGLCLFKIYVPMGETAG